MRCGLGGRSIRMEGIKDGHMESGPRAIGVLLFVILFNVQVLIFRLPCCTPYRVLRTPYSVPLFFCTLTLLCLINFFFFFCALIFCALIFRALIFRALIFRALFFFCALFFLRTFYLCT